MSHRSLLLALLACALLAGCSDRDQPYVEDDGAVPAGAIPAAPEVRPGAPAAPAATPPPATPPGAAPAAAPADTAR